MDKNFLLEKDLDEDIKLMYYIELASKAHELFKSSEVVMDKLSHLPKFLCYQLREEVKKIQNLSRQF